MEQHKKIIIKKKESSAGNTSSRINFDNMDQGTLRKYSEQLATEKLAAKGYKLINISNGREKSLFRIMGKNCNYLCRFMFYRFNPKVKNNYAWILKDKFNATDYQYLIFVLYTTDRASVLLIPAHLVVSEFESRDYIGKKSAPEWGIHLDYISINHLIKTYKI